MVEVTDEVQMAAEALWSAEGVGQSMSDCWIQAFTSIYERGKLEGARLAIEAAAKTARDYAAKAKGRGWMPHADSAPKAAQHVSANIRALSPAKIVEQKD